MHKVWLFTARIAAMLATLFLLAGVFLAPPAHAATDKPSGLPKTLRVGTEGVYPPFSYYDASDKLTGYDVDYIKEVGKRLGVQVKFVETPWDSMFSALQSKRIDLVANQVTLNPERKAKYDLSSPYISTTGVLVVASDNKSIKSLKDLKGKRAGENITSNWAATAKKNGATVVGVDAMDKAISALTQGRVDAIVNDKLAVKNYLNTKGTKGVKIVATTDDKSESVFAARRGSSYMPAIDKEIRAMRQDGTSQKLYDKYFGAKAAEKSGTSDWQVVKDNAWPMLKATLKTTIPLTVVAFLIGLLIAVLVALMRRSSVLVLSWIARVFISIIRGTPLLVQLVIVFYGLPEIGIKFSTFISAAIALSLNVGGYGAEIVRSAISSVPDGQWEAAETIGMDYRTSLRRVILPQASRIAVPPLGNTLLSLVKDTSLTSMILALDLFHQAQIAAAPTYSYFALYCAAAVYYWVICFILNHFQGRLETRLNRYVVR
ncbi:ABC transporter substrate-binding protein [Flexivirga endophytica]|uniref:ABC transporter substrate-binding protein n=1 Tax=Flexivirga endophytica TaxID=1849103 RepID=A0A916T0E7_9MICO|nr:ABC transporter substrate-binding protein/permease [Flexivirga endophytica]GGB25324.1 ABC transporter substrate-binding protein [Flexivirga endophytica]GHB53884.1 ABC transporter substrate-binding protein [Flexivirga endophytica]